MADNTDDVAWSGIFKLVKYCSSDAAEGTKLAKEFLVAFAKQMDKTSGLKNAVAAAKARGAGSSGSASGGGSSAAQGMLLSNADQCGISVDGHDGLDCAMGEDNAERQPHVNTAVRSPKACADTLLAKNPKKDQGKNAHIDLGNLESMNIPDEWKFLSGFAKHVTEQQRQTHNSWLKKLWGWQRRVEKRQMVQSYQ